jgi:hypothetical protein
MTTAIRTSNPTILIKPAVFYKPDNNRNYRIQDEFA